MPADASATRSDFTARAELVLKVGTAVLGTLYVLGLLISNIQLMSVGIPDFQSLQVRNVSTGVLFLVYLGLLLITVAPISFGVVLGWRQLMESHPRRSTRVWKCLRVLLMFGFLFGLTACFAGLLVGFTLPWGRSWEAGMSLQAWSWQFQKNDIATAFGQYAAAFAHKKAIVASCTIGVGLLFVTGRLIDAIARFLVSNAWWEDEPDPHDPESFSQWVRPFLTVYPAMMFPLGVVLALVGFAEEVYPNMRYNLGGGQPQVAELQIDSDKRCGLSIPGLTIACGPGRPEVVTSREPLVIWYRSDKFLYVSPATTSGRTGADLIAIDVGMVRAIRYLSMAVRIGAGSRILALHAQ